MQSYFVWNGTDSRSMGITLRRPAPLIRPEERVRHVTIPGLSGDLTEVEGDRIFNSYIQTIDFSVRGSSRVRSVFDWLCGSGYVSFSGEIDKRQAARVIGAVTLDRVSRNLDIWAGQAQFYCQPFKERIYDCAETLTEAGTIRNAGDVNSYPMILLTPELGADTMTVVVNGKTLTLSEVDGVRRIDCLTQEVSNAGRTELFTKESAGPFPVLKPPKNEISGSGWSTLEIYKRERFL